MVKYGDVNLGQNWFRWWLVASRHQCIAWTNVGSSSAMSSDIHLREYFQEIRQPSITKISLKMADLKCYSNLPETNELIILHYSDIIKGTIVSQITSLTLVYSTVNSDAAQRKHQSSASLSSVRGIHRWSVNSPHNWPVTRKMFPLDNVTSWPQSKLRPPWWLLQGLFLEGIIWILATAITTLITIPIRATKVIRIHVIMMIEYMWYW